MPFATNIDSAFYVATEQWFRTNLEQKGSRLRAATKFLLFSGGKQEIQSLRMSEARIGEPGQDDFSSLVTSKRIGTTDCVFDKTTITEKEVIESAGALKPTVIAERILNTVQVGLDRHILTNLIGPMTTSEGIITLPAENTIAWNDETYGRSANDLSLGTRFGLTPGKISLAVSRMRDRHCYGELICVATHEVMNSLASHERMGNALYRDGQEFANGFSMGSALGVSAFVPLSIRPEPDEEIRNVAIEGLAGTYSGLYNYAYLYAPEHITLISNKDFTLRMDSPSRTNYSTDFYVDGRFGVIREHEEAVMKIAVVKTLVKD